MKHNGDHIDVFVKDGHTTCNVSVRGVGGVYAGVVTDPDARPRDNLAKALRATANLLEQGPSGRDYTGTVAFVGPYNSGEWRVPAHLIFIYHGGDEGIARSTSLKLVGGSEVRLWADEVRGVIFSRSAGFTRLYIEVRS